MCLQSFGYHGFHVNLYTYDPSIVTPPGVQRHDANDVIQAQHVFRNYDQTGSYAAFSNLFRYALLQQVETVWIDTDILSTGQDFPDSEYLFGYESSTMINGAVLAVPRESTLLASLAAESAKLDPKIIRWGELGPKLITKTINEVGLADQAQAREVFYPIEMKNAWRLFDPREIEWVHHEISSACTVHLWNEMMRRATRSVKSMSPPAGSYLGEYCSILDLPIQKLETLDPSWARTVWKKSLDPSFSNRVVAKIRRTIR